MAEEYRFSKTKKRKTLFERAIDRISPLISQTSRSQAVDQAVEMGERYLDRMQEAKKEYESLEKEKQDIERQQRELRQKWETEEIKFEDI